MSALGLNPGADVFVIKANDVIPAITESRPSPIRSIFIIPIKCPSCESTLEKVNDQLFCVNPFCEEKLIGSITHLAKRDALDIEGLSEETAKKLIEYGISDPFDIFTTPVEDIETLPGFAKRSAGKLYKNIQEARNPELKKFLYAAAIPEVGRSVSEDIANHFGSIEAFFADIENGLQETAKIDGIGSVLLNNISTHHNLWDKLLQYVIPKTVVKNTTVSPDEVLTIVVTGSFMDGDKKVSRNEIESAIKELGHKTSGSVSKKTSAILIGNDPGSKADKARELGIKAFISVEGLITFLKNN
jgi:DNA ligase (NAD+)